MKDLVLEIINSYEERLTTIEGLIESTFSSVDGPEAALLRVQDESDKLKESLREAFARNCSLRRKDFDILMSATFDEAAIKKTGLEKERDRVQGELKALLNKQKILIASIRDELSGLDSGISNAGNIEALLDDLKKNWKCEGEEAISLLREFHLQVKTFCREQEILNEKLQTLLKRGEFLRLRDLRQLEAAKNQKKREEVRATRRENLMRMLDSFKDERREMSLKRP